MVVIVDVLSIDGIHVGGSLTVDIIVGMIPKPSYINIRPVDAVEAVFTLRECCATTVLFLAKLFLGLVGSA